MIAADGHKTTLFLMGATTFGRGVPDTTGAYPGVKQWRSGTFFHDNNQVPWHYAPAANPKAVFVGCSGINTHYLLEPKQIKKMNDAGISVIWMVLPPVHHEHDFMDHYLALTKEFFTSPRSPAKTLEPTNLPRFCGGRSTGAQLLLWADRDPDTHRKLTHNFMEAAYMAPCLGFSNAFKLAAFSWYANKKPDVTPHERFFSNMFLKKRAANEPFYEEGPEGSPIFSELVDILGRGYRLTHNFDAEHKISLQEVFLEGLKKVWWGSEHLTDNVNVDKSNVLPSAFYLGDDDPFVKHDHAARFARSMGADIYTIKGGGHNPFKTRAGEVDPLNLLIDRILTKAKTYRVSEHVLAQAQPPWSAVEKIEPTKWEELSYSARFALQSGAGFLNSAAGLLKGFFRRGVGNAEVRRKPESNALHSGHALRL